MKKRRNADEVARLLRDVDRDLAKGLTVSDACRKIGIAETTYYRWRQRHDSAVVVPTVAATSSRPWNRSPIKGGPRNGEQSTTETY